MNTTPIIPALDLIDGQIVRLYQGDYNRQTDYGADPIARAQQYAAEGAERLHLVDLSGARDPAARQTALITRLIAACPLPVQIGGGIRSSADIDTLLAAGAARIVIGSLAVKAPATVQNWLATYGGEHLVLALDVHPGADGHYYVAHNAWQEGGQQTLSDLITAYQPHGLRHILCTDISRDGTLQGANTALYRELHAAYPELNIQASGGIGNLDHIRALNGSGVSGIITGRALLDGRITLKEALTCWPNA